MLEASRPCSSIFMPIVLTPMGNAVSTAVAKVYSSDRMYSPRVISKRKAMSRDEVLAEVKIQAQSW